MSRTPVRSVPNRRPASLPAKALFDPRASLIPGEAGDAAQSCLRSALNFDDPSVAIARLDIKFDARQQLRCDSDALVFRKLKRILKDRVSRLRDRQVVVFTHDDRLPEAVRRLGIDATVLEVTRREASAVEVRKGRDPVARHREDAMAMAYTESLPAPAAKRVIPGLCRLAIEAACVETVRR